MANDLSILMPVFNEYSTVDAAIRDGLDADLPVARRELVVDDGSTVGTRELLGEPEIAARVLRAGERIHEVPISYKARGRDAGKKLTAFDGVRVLRTLVRCRVM
ncbi:MAG TPA: hypothetical protein VFR38_03885 [Gaiellaceae bacterium]|nr:hypothetical protein [Gaiellaceae bacterium]